MKLKNFVKLFSFVSFLMLSCCFVPKIFAADYKGIDYTLEGSTLTINKDIEDEKIRIEFAKTLREKCPEIRVVQTPLFRYTLKILEAKGTKTCKDVYSRVAEIDSVSVTWEFIKPVTPPEKPNDEITKALKIESFVPFIIFDTVNDNVGCAKSYRRDGDPELYLTKSGGFGIRKQETVHYGTSTTRDNKRLICEFYVDPKIRPFFKRVTQIVANKDLFAKGSGKFECRTLKWAFLSASSSSSSSSTD